MQYHARCRSDECEFSTPRLLHLWWTGKAGHELDPMCLKIPMLEGINLNGRCTKPAAGVRGLTVRIKSGLSESVGERT